MRLAYNSNNLIKPEHTLVILASVQKLVSFSELPKELAMPIDYRIDSIQKVVFAKARGCLTDQDVFGYQQAVWSAPEVAGYDELIDMTEVQEIIPPTGERVRDLASFSAQMDHPDRPSRFAIAASQDFAYGLERMYAAYRELSAGSKKKVAVFRSRKEGLDWLGIEDQDSPD